MAGFSDSTVGVCGDTPLGIASSVLAFYTAAVALGFTLYGFVILWNKASSEMVALDQEVLMLNLEYNILIAAKLGVGASTEKTGLPADVSEMESLAIDRSATAVEFGLDLIHSQSPSSSTKPGTTPTATISGGPIAGTTPGEPAVDKTSSTSTTSSIPRLGSMSVMSRLRWIASSAARARELTVEAGKCRELLSTCERMLILHHVQHSSSSTRPSATNLYDRINRLQSIEAEADNPPGPEAPEETPLQKAYEDWTSRNPPLDLMRHGRVLPLGGRFITV